MAAAPTGIREARVLPKVVSILRICAYDTADRAGIGHHRNSKHREIAAVTSEEVLAAASTGCRGPAGVTEAGSRLRLIGHQIVVVAQSVLDVERPASRCVGISSARGQHTQGPIILTRSFVTRFISISRTPVHPGCCWISANARHRKACIESRVLEGSGSLSVIPPRSSPCQHSLIECRQKLPLCILARSAGLCARMGCDASSP
jgi:hypothetical protein